MLREHLRSSFFDLLAIDHAGQVQRLASSAQALLLLCDAHKTLAEIVPVAGARSEPADE